MSRHDSRKSGIPDVLWSGIRFHEIRDLFLLGNSRFRFPKFSVICWRLSLKNWRTI
uniref:Uncharacterized protein n=1 Tax=Meloidogyne enterolobii TaxID=390850 RepID=A0A6V7Y0R3_MELEN|nr:unnamed protein product [Meloidogyne enterolobii]